jgi:glycosyltransferase involved in cell wall biosynthesis
MSLKISIALCTFNGAEYLEPQLQSYLRQDRLPDELVAADDGSGDGTVAMVRQFASRAPFPVRLLVNSQRLGVSRNFEEALKACSGELIFLSDQDDSWDNAKLSTMAATMEKEPGLQALFCNAKVTDAHLNPLGYSLWQAVGFDKSEQQAFTQGAGYKVLLKHNVVAGATLALRRDALPQLVPLAPNWMHDSWMAMRLAACDRIRPLPKALQSYRQHPAQHLGVQWQDLRLLTNQAISHDGQYYRQLQEQMVHFLMRLPELGKVGSPVESAMMAKISHLRHRGTLPQQTIRRIYRVAMECVNGNYHAFSLGFKSAVKDCLSAK